MSKQNYIDSYLTTAERSSRQPKSVTSEEDEIKAGCPPSKTAIEDSQDADTYEKLTPSQETREKMYSMRVCMSRTQGQDKNG